MNVQYVQFSFTKRIKNNSENFFEFQFLNKKQISLLTDAQNKEKAKRKQIEKS